MIFLSTLVYDSTQKVNFDYALAALIFLLMMLGIFLLKASKVTNISKLKPGILTMVWLFLLKAHPRKNKIYGRIALISSVFIAFLYVYNYLAVKRPDWFYSLNSISGRIEKAEKKTVKGLKFYIIQIKGNTYYFENDKGYVATRILAPKDSVTIRFYNETSPHLIPGENKKIVKLELE